MTLHDPLIKCLAKSHDKLKLKHIYPTTTLAATGLDRMATDHEEFPSITSLYCLIT